MSTADAMSETEPRRPGGLLFGKKRWKELNNRKTSRGATAAAAAAASVADSRNDDGTEVDRYTPQQIAKRHLVKKLFSTLHRDREPEDASLNADSVAASRVNRVMQDKRQMKAVYHQFGTNPTDVIQVETDSEMPRPLADDHVLVKVQASTITIGDCFFRRGFCFDVVHPICLPVTPGHDFVGHIVARGPNATTFKEGDRVAGLVRTGGNARYISVPESSLVSVPRHVDSAEAAAMVTIYTTAYQTLKAVSNKNPMFSLDGKKVLVVGGMDGVGQALIQMCRKARADVYATGPTRRHAYMRNVLGVTPLPDVKEDWLRRVFEEMDIVLDGMCDDGLSFALRALKPDGELVCFGNSSVLQEKEIGVFGAPFSAHISKFWSRTQPRTKFVDIWDNFENDPETFKKNLKSLFQLLRWDKIKPHIAKRVCLSEVADAQARLERGEMRGTMVCLPWKRVGAAADEVRED